MIALVFLPSITNAFSVDAFSKERLVDLQFGEKSKIKTPSQNALAIQYDMALVFPSEVPDDERSSSSSSPKDSSSRRTQKLLQKFIDYSKENFSLMGRPPPFRVDDMSLMLYDIFLIINLAVSISFHVVHRMDPTYLGAAFNEGCLLSLLWICSGLYSGAFLNSAVDGHYDDERGGPKAAGLLGFHTFINTVNLRLLFALVVAFKQHRPVGMVVGEQLMPLEVGFGLILMSSWRTLHSFFVPRI